ncbi:MAG: zinc metalloprotease, partial [Flavobacteriales bacterium]|nr:zinc metalloprotease [Flavobacteriales bacterium]
MKKVLLAFGLMVGMVLSISAQRNCGSMEYLEQQKLNDSKIQEKMQEIELHTKDFIDHPTERVVNGVVTIPVVVHVVYNNGSENISDAQVQSQIDVLNADFRRFNSDADGTWSQAEDSEIEFCLATVDPNGNATNGITRTSTSTSAFGTNDQVKFNSSGGKDAWDASQYMNMWVCDISGGILGYAQFPGGSSSTDGIVIDYQYFGTIGTASAPFDLGRTATHEVGHYLNLRHIWGDGGCSVDDFVSDTPTSDNPNYGCATGHVSCGSTDMVQNYMDYSDDACMNLFTAGQNVRMRALFDNGGFRESLGNSSACGTPPPPATCNDGIQNQGETGVDCGGPNCAPCPCNGTNVTVSITLDNYPEETTWSITQGGSTVASGGTYGSQPDGSTVNIDLCLADGCYDFTINDSYGDGICCGYGNGSYTVSSSSGTLASGGSFGSIETTNFCVGGGPAPTCDDGIQNQGETGVDCGGPCAPCATCNDGIQNQGETGVDCGGPCAACPTCDDGIQNGDETGVD